MTIYETLYAQSQTCQYAISGRVIDHASGLPIAGATVHLLHTDKRNVTDGHGHFQIGGICAGKHEIRITSVGFKEHTATIQLRNSQTTSIRLRRDSITLESISVIGHQSASPSTATTRQLSAENIAEHRGHDLATLMANVPGVTLLESGGTIAKPVVNGLHSTRILLLNNGVRQEGQQWGADHAPEIDPFIAQRFSVVKGAESLRYGADALGGVIRVIPAPLPTQPKLGGEFHGIGMNNGHVGNLSASLQGGWKSLRGLGWRIQVSGKRSGNIRTPDYYLNNTGTASLNLSGALGYASKSSQYEVYGSLFNNEAGILTATHVGDQADVDARLVYGRPYPIEDLGFSYQIDVPRQTVSHTLLKAKYHQDFDNGSNLNLLYGFQKNHRKEFDRRRAERSALPVMDMVLTTQTLDADYTMKYHQAFRHTIGLNTSVQVNNNVPGTNETPLIPNFDSYGLGLYSLQRFVSEQSEYELGIRYDYKYFDAAGYNREQVQYGGARDFHNLSATLGGLWRLSQHQEIRSNLGLAWRAPAANELYSNSVHNSVARYEQGNDALKSEQGYKWVSSYDLQHEIVQVNIDAYAQYINNYIYGRPTDDLWQHIGGTFPIWEYVQTNALFGGVDFSASVAIAKALTYTLKSSLIRAKNTTENSYLPLIPADRFENQLRYMLRFGNSSLQEIFIQPEHVYVAKQHRFNPNIELDTPPEAYHLFHLGVGSSWIHNEHKISLHLAANNLFDNLYKDYTDLFRYYAHARGRNITVRVAYHF